MESDKDATTEYKLWMDGEPLNQPNLDDLPKLAAVSADKRKKRRAVRARRAAFLLVALLIVLCTAAAIGMLAKAICIVNDGDHMLLPLLMTATGAAGALALLAELLLSKEPK